jgi:hypothetical protein
VDVALVLIFSFKIKLKLLKMIRRLVNNSWMLFSKVGKSTNGDTHIKSEVRSSGKISQIIGAVVDV